MVVSMQRWSGKVAVVTGASIGIGQKIVEMLVKNGMIVIGLARRVDLIEKLAKSLESQPGKLLAMKIDMTNHDALVKVFEEIEKKYDPIHVLVNNAGVYPPASILTGSTEQMRKIMDTNVIALCIATREGIRIMRNNGVEGYVININSVAGHIVPPVSELDIYSASKFAVTAICESTRKELVREGSKIRVTSISPGVVHTDGWEQLGLEKNYGPVPFLKPEDVADTVEFALSTPPHVQITELTIRPVGAS